MTIRSATSELPKYYSDQFYQGQMDGSYRGAVRYVELLSSVCRPASVVDLGCGRGMWLKAFRDFGTSILVGYDGPWNAQENMVDESIRFFEVDLNEPINVPETQRFDLAMSLEVAEHLEPASAAGFVQSLVNLSDAVLFSAAYTRQGGTNHINEQPHSYWARLFQLHDYQPYDLFRRFVWGDPDIPYWYQQNVFFYARNGSAVASELQSKGHLPLANIRFMDCVHPALYEARSRFAPKAARTFLMALPRRVLPNRLRPAARRLKSLAAAIWKGRQ